VSHPVLRYAAFHWNDRDAQAGALARASARHITAGNGRWQPILAHDGILVLCIDARPATWNVYLLPGDRGLLLGTLFRKKDARHCDQRELNDPGLLASPSDVARRLVTEYWGRYVAFLHHFPSRALTVLRDPIGGLPCFHACSRGVNVIFSFLDDCLASGLIPVSIDWRFVRTHVANGNDKHAGTGIHGVLEILPGTSVTFSDGDRAATETVWSPRAIASSGMGSVTPPLDRLLRETTETCVGAWAKLHGRILHRLSGGLDSSIVAGCLAGPSHVRSHQVTCINYHDDGGPGDERAQARLVANANGMPLLELPNRTDVSLADVFDARSFPRPMEYQGCVRRRVMESALFAELGVSACSSGIGGDQLFFQNPVQLAAADWLLQRGFSLSFMRYVCNVADNQAVSVWSVLRTAAGALLSGRRNPRARARHHTWYVAPDVIHEAAANTCRAEQEFMPDVPPAKQLHLRIRNVRAVPYAPVGRGPWPDPILPLLSQPLVELCLRTPVFDLAPDGRDRGLARRAFHGLVPEPILHRTRKGSVDNQLERLLTFNLPFLREALLDGNLVQQGLLDRKKLETGLSSTAVVTGRHAGELICRHLNTEVWVTTALRQCSQARP
jgi:asparagine synthase (glutamine-hydrolysing)